MKTEKDSHRDHIENIKDMIRTHDAAVDGGHNPYVEDGYLLPSQIVDIYD